MIIRHEIATAIPELLDHVCRAGNADHGTQRVATLINVWRRMFMLKSADPQLSDEELTSRTARGLSSELSKEVPFLPKFVRTWSGGKDGSVLRDLERHEQGSKIKRKLKGIELKQMAELPVHIFRLWIPAMVKASLQAPKEYLANGLWTVGDLNQLKNQTQKIMPLVKQGTADMDSARTYIQAHTIGIVEQRRASALLGQLDLIRFFLRL